jgi:hypothetical protein
MNAARTSLLVSAVLKKPALFAGGARAAGSLFHHPFLLASRWTSISPASADAHDPLGRRCHHLSSSSNKTRDKNSSKKESSGERLVVRVNGNRNTVLASLPLPPSPPPLPPSNPTSQDPPPVVYGVIIEGTHKGKVIKNPEYTPTGRVKGYIWNEDKSDWVRTYNLSPKHVLLTVPLTTTTLPPKPVKPKVPPATTPSRP